MTKGSILQEDTAIINIPPKNSLLLLSRFSRVRLCVTPETAAHKAPLSLGFSRQEHRSGLPCPSPTHESEKWKGSRSVMSDFLRPHGLQPTRLLCPWDFPGKSTGVGCHCRLARLVITFFPRSVFYFHGCNHHGLIREPVKVNYKLTS